VETDLFLFLGKIGANASYQVFFFNFSSKFKYLGTEGIIRKITDKVLADSPYNVALVLIFFIFFILLIERAPLVALT